MDKSPPDRLSQVTELIVCPVCRGNRFRKLFEKKGRSFYVCQTCGLQKQHPLPSQAELAEYYESSYVSGLYEEFASVAYLKDLTAQQRLQEASKFVPLRGRWLDVGTSTGNLVKALIERGVQAEGIELSQTAVHAAQREGLPVRAMMLSDLPQQHVYDCITAYDLIEHVLDPAEFIRDVLLRLKVGGHLIMSLPNLAVLQRYLMGSRWYFYIPEEHLHYFTPKTMRRFLTGFGFDPVKIGATYKPMTFDYAQAQFAEYNPLIHRCLSFVGRLTPAALRRYPLSVPIGEMRVVAKRMTHDVLVPEGADGILPSLVTG